MRDTLLACRFPMRHINTACEPLDFVAEGLHINPIKLFAIVLNVWLALKLISTSPASATNYIADLLSDNTSAISWLKIAARVRDPGLVAWLVSPPLFWSTPLH
jgi:hypothetical protein